MRAAEALGRIGDAKAIIPLKEALIDEDGIVRVFAKNALEKIKTKQKARNVKKAKGEQKV